MNKILIIAISILLAIAIGFALSLSIGPMQLDGFSMSDLYSKDDEDEDSEEADEGELEQEPEKPAIVSDNPMVGRWEVINLVEIDPHNMDEIGASLEFFDDGTGIEHHSEEPRIRDMTWKAESGRLTITPKDTSFAIRTYEFELDNNIITIFFNTNRTSYFEAIKTS